MAPGIDPQGCDFVAASTPCTDLQGLWVHGNLLSALPSNLGHLTSLRTLQLVGNRLQALPESISALTQLTDLGLAGNQLTAAPAVLGSLSELAVNGVPRSSQAQICVAVSSHASGGLLRSLLSSFLCPYNNLVSILFRPLLTPHCTPKYVHHAHLLLHCSCWRRYWHASFLLCKSQLNTSLATATQLQDH